MTPYLQLPRTSGIYSITNLTNGKRYIGSAVNLRQRAYDHVSALNRNAHNSKHLQNAWNKYGEASFTFEILMLVIDKAQLIQWENHFIEERKSRNAAFGYNLCPAQSSLGYKHTDEAKRKIKEARAKQEFSAETRAKMSATRLGKKMNFSPAVRKMLSEKAKTMDRSANQTPEFRAKMQAINKARADSKGKLFICNETGDEFKTTGDASKRLGVSYKSIWRVLKGHRQSVCGYTFSYLPSVS